MNGNVKIAKNSIILFFRLIITTFIGLYSSRLVLQELGIDNFGLYSVVGGIVALLNVLNSSMISTSNRFIAVEIGKSIRNEEMDHSSISKIFNTVLVLHIFLSTFILFFGEVVGTWYIYNHFNILKSKIPDAMFVLHCSVLTAAFATVVVPFQGLLLAYEKFNIRATFEILQSIIHFLFIVGITYLSVNKLRIYSLAVFIIGILVFLLHYFYVKYRYEKETKWKINKNIRDYKEVFSFLGWTLFYVFGSSGSKQGGVIILNKFYGTNLNAAFSVGSRVFEMVYSFVKNLNQAAIPQIMTNYSSGQQEKSLMLIYKLSKITFFIMYLFSLPLLLSMNSALELWLGKVPPYSNIFASLMIIHGLICCLESGFDAAIDSTGKIKRTKILFNITMLGLLPILYLLYSLNYPPYFVVILTILAEIIFVLIQINILKNLIKFNIKDYFLKSIVPVLTVVVLSLPLVYLRKFFDNSLIDTSIFTSISLIITILLIFVFGLTKHENKQLFSYFVALKTKIF